MPRPQPREEVRFPELEHEATLSIETLFAEVEPQQSRYAYIWATRSLTSFRVGHTAFDSDGVKPEGTPSASDMTPGASMSGVVAAVREWLSNQPTPPDRRKLVWRIKPGIVERKRGLHVRYAAYCRLALVLVGDELTFPEDHEACRTES